MSEKHDGEMEKLSRAIVEAIINSEDVKSAIEKIGKIDEKMAKSMMVFILKLDSLTDFKGGFADFEEDMDKFEDIPPARLKKRKSRKKQEKAELVDGKIISGNEKKFLEFLSNNFDSKDWLKKNKISLD